MKPRIAHLLVLLALVLPAAAQTTLQAVLDGSQEVPPHASVAYGYGVVTLNAAQNQITVTESWIGLSGSPTATHIHGPAPAGVNAGVLFTLTGVTFAATGSLVPNNTFNVTPLQAYYLLNNLCYFNVHTVMYPGGEIRGQIINTNAIAAPKLTGFTVETNGLRVNWSSALGGTNSLQRLTSLTTTNYTPLLTLTNQLGGATNYLDPAFATNPAAIYRIRWHR